MSKESQPNILWICTDQQRFDTIHSMGNPHIRTPNLDRLVSEGVAFSNAYCQNPVCSPSRASFLTGRYPRTARLRQNGTKIPDDEVLITRILADEGYRCGLAGKLHLAPCDGMMEERIDDGYHDFNWSHGPWPKWERNAYIDWVGEQGKPWEEVYPLSPEVANKLGSQGLAPGGKFTWAGMPTRLHQSYWCVEKAIDFMKKNRDTSWLFSVNAFDPHHPFDPPGEFLEHYDPDTLPSPCYTEGELENKPVFQMIDHEAAMGGRSGISFKNMTDRQHREITAAYYAMIENVDFNVGRLLKALEETGQRENTLIIFMSDHGEMLGDHGIYLKGPFLYEQAVKVPLILSCPGRLKSDLKSDALVELVDLAPTILDFVGLPAQERMQGKSFLDICTGETDPGQHRDTVYCEYYNSLVNHRDPAPYLTMVRDRRFKMIAYSGMDTGELYDMQEDPGEIKNLWSDPEYGEIKCRYLKKCLDASVFTVDPLPERVGEF